MISGGRGDLLVGRDEEVAQLVRLVDVAAGGNAGALLVSGEAGAGKTALVRAACGRRTDVAVVWATCLPLSSLLVSFLPLRSALREWAAQRPSEALTPAFSAVVAASGADMPVLFDEWLRECGRLQPVVLVLDDLQWADRSTLDVLMYVLTGLGRRNLAVLATVRTGEQAEADPLQAWLADVRRFAAVQELHLGRLDRFGTSQQMANLMAGPPRESLVDDVFARTCGNPYWTQLLVRDLSPDTVRLAADLPSQLTQAVSRTWTRMTASARRVARVVAIGGRPQGEDRITQVAAAVEMADSVVAVLREVVDAGVLVRSAAGYWFAHPLLAEVLVAGMLPGERELIYAAYAQVLDASAANLGAVDPQLAAELADAHYGARHIKDAHDWALQAATAMRSIGAETETIRLLRRALDLSPQLPSRQVEPFEILERIRAASEQIGDLEQELRSVEDMIKLLDPGRQPLLVSRLLVRRSLLRMATGLEFNGVEDMREAVRLSAQEPHSPEHATALAHLARNELWQGISTGPEHAEEALLLARRCGEPQALSYALSSRVMARVIVDEDDSGIDDAIEAQQTAVQAGDWWALVHATFWRANSIDAMISPAFIDCLRSGRENLTSRGAPHVYVALLSAAEAAALLHLGRWRECLARLREVFGVSPGPMTAVTARLVGAQLACWQGRGPEAQAHLARAEELLAGHAFKNVELDAVRAELAVVARQTEQVLALVPDRDDDVPPTLVERLIPLAGRAMADQIQAIRDGGGDDRQARERFRAFRLRHPSVIADSGPGELAEIQVGAMQAWYDAEFERAERSASAGSTWLLAAERCQAGLLAWDEAYARTRAAETLLPKRTTHAEGVTALRRAWELASHLEAVPMLAQITTLAQSAHVRLGAPESVDLSAPPLLPGLTPREREILAHVIAGRTYSEIAGALVISEKTVSVHISNLLRKTGTTSRVELAQLVHRSNAQS